MDIEDFLINFKPKIKPSIRTIDKEKKEFALVNLLKGENKTLFVSKQNVENAKLAFSCFLTRDTNHVVQPQHWVLMPTGKKNEDSSLTAEIAVPYREDNDKVKVFDKTFNEGSLINVNYDKELFLIDKLSAGLLETTIIMEVKVSPDEGWIEEIIFRDDSTDNETKEMYRKNTFATAEFLLSNNN